MRHEDKVHVMNRISISDIQNKSHIQNKSQPYLGLINKIDPVMYKHIIKNILSLKLKR